MNKSNSNTSWGNVAKWYNKLLEENQDTYQSQVILPNLLRCLQPKNGQKILDLRCGQGFFSKNIARLGAHTTGVDISKELVNLAKLSTSKNENYFVMNAENLTGLKNDHFDAGICVLAMQNVQNYERALAEISRVLKPSAKFILILNHPCFRIPKNSEWGFDENKEIQYRKIDSYLSPYEISIDMNPGESQNKNKVFTKSFHRPLQNYFKAFYKSNFTTIKLEEWISHKESAKGKRKLAEDKARKEFPLFLCLELKKC